MSWFLKSIGVDPQIIEHIGDASLAFQRPMVFWLGLLALVPGSYYIIWRQRHNLSTVSRAMRFTLSAIRIVILLLMFWVLAGPTLSMDHRFEKKPVVAVVLDQSQSMNLPAGPISSESTDGYADAIGQQIQNEVDVENLNRMSRWDMTRRAAIHKAETLFKELDQFDVRYYTFDRTMSPVADLNESPKDEVVGAATYIGDAIQSVIEDAAGRPVAGIILFSDGRNTGGSSPAQVARQLQEAGTPIFAIPIGSSERMPDISIVDVFTSGLVSVGDLANVSVTLESRGFNGRTVNVELKDGEELLDLKELTLNDAEQQQLDLSFETKVAGSRYLTVEIAPQPEETEQLHANNRDMAFLRVSDDKIRVLYADGFPRWDFRFLKNAMRRDHGLAGRVSEQPDIVVETEFRRLTATEQLKQLPRSLDEFKQYHTIILGDASLEMLPQPWQEMLIEAVTKHGVGLIVAAGPVNMPAKYSSRFLELLPMTLQAGLSGLEAPVYSPYVVELTPDGTVHETMRLYDDSGRNQTLWAEMPPYFWMAPVERATPGAIVMANNPAAQGRFGKMPVIAYQFAGKGKVMFIATDSTWLWRQYVGDRFFYKFWGQSLRFVARRDDTDADKNWIEVRPIRAQPGEEVQVELLAVADGAPKTAPSLTVDIVGDENSTSMKITADPATPGRYVGSFQASEVGDYKVTYQDGLESAEAQFRVMVAPDELRHPSLDRPSLDRLARNSGGVLVELPEFDQIKDRLKGEVRQGVLHRESSVWDNWLILTLLVTLYCVDVAIRRLTGLS